MRTRSIGRCRLAAAMLAAALALGALGYGAGAGLAQAWPELHAAAASTTFAAAGAAEIRIDNFSFAPQATTVASGTAVTWVNEDDIPHNIVAEDASFRSSALDTDDSFRRVFDKPGTYAYYCSLHPRMVGRIVVTAAP